MNETLDVAKGVRLSSLGHLKKLAMDLTVPSHAGYAYMESERGEVSGGGGACAQHALEAP